MSLYIDEPYQLLFYATNSIPDLVSEEACVSTLSICFTGLNHLFKFVLHRMVCMVYHVPDWGGPVFEVYGFEVFCVKTLRT